MITVIDYGASNLRSVEKAFKFLGEDVTVTSDPKKIVAADRLVLPGNGAFGDCISNLKHLGIDDAIKKYIETDRYFFGICIGMQVLADVSYEFGKHAGLGYIKGEVKLFELDDTTLKIPHTGWDNLKFNTTHKIFDGIDDNSYFYFVHSYYLELHDKKYLAGTTDYGITFTSAVIKDNIIGTQFHPEKSQKSGLKLLDNFCKL